MQPFLQLRPFLEMKLTFPHDDHFPPEAFDCSCCKFVPFSIPRDLILPPLRPCFRWAEFPAFFVPVPKTSVDENNGFSSR